MASALWQRLMADRAWYAPEPAPVPRLVTVDELVARAYAEAGPKAGKRPRRDAIETLAAGLRYLHVRAASERDGAGSGDFATTAGQTIDGLMYDLSRRSAKPWDRRVGAGLGPWPRRQVRVRKYGSAVRKLLDELAGCGLLVWGGELDNNGLWWRLRIRLLDPDGPPVAREPWMRPSPRLTDRPSPGDNNANGGRRRGEGAGGSAGRRDPRERIPELEALYDLVAGHGHDRPRFAGRLERRIVAAADRYREHVSQRPRGLSEDPWAVLGNLLEQHALHTAGDAFLRALPFFDALTRRMEKAAKNGPEAVAAVAASVNCAALRRNQQTTQTANRVDLPSALAPRTGARVGDHDRNDRAILTESSAERSEGSKGGQGQSAPDPFPGVAERVAARERRWEALMAPARARDAQTLERARSWPSDTPISLGLLTAAAAILHGGRRPWLDEHQLAKLRRAEARYARHADQRPPGARAAPAAVLIALLEARPAHTNHPLAWAAVQLDLLSKRMRRQATRPVDPAVLEASRRRAQRRRTRRVHDAHACFWRRPEKREPTIDQTIQRLARRVTEHRLGEPIDITLARSARRLERQGVAVTAEQLRRELRDELLIAGADAHHLNDIDGPGSGLGPPGRFDPSQAQLHPDDPHRLAAHPALLRHRRRDHRHASHRARHVDGTDTLAQQISAGLSQLKTGDPQ